jgi:type IV secretory pathway protease TraF
MKIRGYLTLNDEKITLKKGILKMEPQSVCIMK